MNNNPTVVTSKDYVISLTNQLILVDSSSGNINITLPDLKYLKEGATALVFYVKKISGDANTVSIRCSNSSQNIDNVISATLTSQNECKGFVFDTYSNYRIITSFDSGGGGGTVTNVFALTLGTTGTDLSSSVVNSTTRPAITLNVPTASALNRGALSSTDWSLFNSKQSALGYTPENIANKTDVMSGNTASSTVYLSAKGVYDWVTSNTPIKIATDHTSYPVTGGTTEVIALAALIPANSVITNKSLEIGWRIIRSSGTAGTITPRLRVSTSAAPSPVSGASQLALGQVIGTSNNFEQLKRTLVYKSATATTMFPSNTQAPSDDILSGSAQTTLNIDWTVNQYILFTIQNANNADVSSLEHIDIFLI